MLAITACEDGFREAIGIPTVFFSKEDLIFILKNAQARLDLIRVYGEGVCIGTLGDSIGNGCYAEAELLADSPDSEGEGDMGYYASL